MKSTVDHQPDKRKNGRPVKMERITALNGDDLSKIMDRIAHILAEHLAGSRDISNSIDDAQILGELLGGEEGLAAVRDNQEKLIEQLARCVGELQRLADEQRSLAGIVSKTAEDQSLSSKRSVIDRLIRLCDVIENDISVAVRDGNKFALESLEAHRLQLSQILSCDFDIEDFEAERSEMFDPSRHLCGEKHLLPTSPNAWGGLEDKMVKGSERRGYEHMGTQVVIRKAKASVWVDPNNV